MDQKARGPRASTTRLSCPGTVLLWRRRRSHAGTRGDVRVPPAGAPGARAPPTENPELSKHKVETRGNREDSLGRYFVKVSGRRCTSLTAGKVGLGMGGDRPVTKTVTSQEKSPETDTPTRPKTQSSQFSGRIQSATKRPNIRRTPKPGRQVSVSEALYPKRLPLTQTGQTPRRHMLAGRRSHHHGGRGRRKPRGQAPAGAVPAPHPTGVHAHLGELRRVPRECRNQMSHLRPCLEKKARWKGRDTVSGSQKADGQALATSPGPCPPGPWAVDKGPQVEGSASEKASWVGGVV